METLGTPISAYAPQDGVAREEPDAASLPERSPRPSRWRVWVSLAVGLVVLRLAFSIVLAPLLASRLSRVLGARVDIGDVSFAPIDAVVTLRAVTVQAPETTGAPAIVADRVRLDVQWLPLMHRSLLVRELRLESARIELDRLTGGGASLETFLRADPASELPPDWTFGLDRIVLRDTALRLRDVENGDPAALEVELHEAQVSALPQRATAFGRAPNLHVDAAVAGGRIRVDGSSDLRDDGVLLDARMRAKGVPVALVRSYLPDLGWSRVRGRLSANLHYRRHPARRDLLTGRLLLRRIEVRVPALVEPALSIRRAVVEVEKVDLLARRVAIGSLTLDDAALAARPDLTVPIPLLEGARISPAPRHRTRPAPGARATPWRWTIARVTAPSAKVRFAGRDGAIVVDASLAAENLGPAAYWSPVRAWFRSGDGAAAFDGTARMRDGLVIDGRLTAGAIDVPGFARAVGVPFADLAQAGRGAADVILELAPGAIDGSAVDVRGRVSLVALAIAGPDATTFALGADTMKLELAGILARGDTPERRSLELRISHATVGAPQVQVARTAEGWVLPPFADDVGPPAPPPALAADLPDESSPDVQLAIGHLRTNGGRVTILDTAVSPPVTIDLNVNEAWGSDLRLPGGTLGDFVLAGNDRSLGALRLAGIGGVAGRVLELSGESVPLAAAAPFLVRAGFPYRLEGGTASFLSRVDVVAGRWTADTTLTLREPTVTGDTAALEEALGRSVESALSALRDPNGDVTFQLALAAPGPGDARTLPDAVAQGVRDALEGATPFRIAFVPGRVELTAHGARQIAAIAEVLESRPNLVVELAAAVSSDDRRWLAEQALAADLEPAGGFKSVLRTFGIRDGRERIRRALEDRAEGRPGRLDADDEAGLDALLAQRAPVDAAALAALAGARLVRVTAELADQHAIAPGRVVVADAGPDDGGAAPAVRGRIAVESRIAPPAAPTVGPPPPVATTSQDAW